MKTQIKKLSLNKRTISNLDSAEMNRQVGGGKTGGNGHTCKKCTVSCVWCGGGGGTSGGQVCIC